MEDCVSMNNKMSGAEQPTLGSSFNDKVAKRQTGQRGIPAQLPHLQKENKTLFVTFCTHRRWTLPESVRDLVLRHCLHDNGKKLHTWRGGNA
jgi:hypothetical protein